MPTEEQLKDLQESIKNAEDKLAEWDTQLRLAERAGIDVTEQRKRFQETKLRVSRMKSVYGG